MQAKNMLEEKIINDFIQQIRVGNYIDENGHELINNASFIKFRDLWFEDKC